MAEKRIAILTLSFGEPRLMLAGSVDGMIHIMESKQLEQSLPYLKKRLPTQLRALSEKGFTVLVDEVVPYFSQFGRAVKLSDLDGEGKPIIVSAMQAYLNLSKYKALSLPSSAGGMFDVSSSVVEEVRGPDGRPTYNIDWAALTPDNVAMLLAVYAGTQDSLFDRSSMTELLTLIGSKPAKPAHNAMNNIMRSINSNQLSVDALGIDHD